MNELIANEDIRCGRCVSKLFGLIAIATRGRVGPAAHGWPVERSSAAPINSRFIDIDTARV